MFIARPARLSPSPLTKLKCIFEHKCFRMRHMEECLHRDHFIVTHIAGRKTFLSLTWREGCQHLSSTFHRSIKEDEMRWAAHRRKGCIDLYFFCVTGIHFRVVTLSLTSFPHWIMPYWDHPHSFRPHIISYMILYQLWVTCAACRERKAQKQVYVYRIKTANTVLLVFTQAQSLTDTYRVSAHRSAKYCISGKVRQGKVRGPDLNINPSFSIMFSRVFLFFLFCIFKITKWHWLFHKWLGDMKQRWVYLWTLEMYSVLSN